MPSATAIIIAIATSALLRPVAAQISCGGDSYVPGTRNMTLACYNQLQGCMAKLQANASLPECVDTNVDIQQQYQGGNTQNTDITTAFTQIEQLCLLSGSTSATWGWSNGQWYWIWTADSCYIDDPNNPNVLPTHPAPYCIQNSGDVLPQCYPEPEPVSGGPVKVVKTGRTAHGYTSAARGWNTYGVQALVNGSQVVPSFAGQSGLDYTQKFVETQCGVLAEAPFKKAGYDLCSLDSGWQAFNAVDEYGRITYNTTRFNMPQLGSWLHERDLKFGVYTVPGVPCVAQNKTIKGTNIKVGDAWNGNYDGIFCDWNFTADGVQQWHDSVVELWASWGVDMIKLDFLTPGSPQNGENLVCDNSAAVTMYHNAIKKSGKQIRLDLSWKLCRNETWLPFWSGLAESMRTDQDLDNYGTNTLMGWNVGQRAIDNYRQYISLQAQRNVPVTIYPDMDGLFIANPEALAGVNDTLRYTVMNHWLGAATNLIIGGDMTQIDDLGLKLTTSPETIAAADFFAQFPMQPRNPGTGGNTAQQLQAWIGGPRDDGKEAYVLIVNYGADGGQGGFGTKLYGQQKITVSLKDLGIDGAQWSFTDVWAHNSTKVSNTYTAWLADGASQLLHLTKIKSCRPSSS